MRTISDTAISNVAVAIRNASDDVSIHRVRITGTTEHGITSSGNSVSIFDARIDFEEGNGITILGDDIELHDVVIVGAGNGIGISVGQIEEPQNARTLNEIFDLLEENVRRVPGDESDFCISQFQELRLSKRVSEGAYNRITSFLANHASILGFSLQIFPALFR